MLLDLLRAIHNRRLFSSSSTFELYIIKRTRTTKRLIMSFSEMNIVIDRYKYQLTKCYDHQLVCIPKMHT